MVKFGLTEYAPDGGVAATVPNTRHAGREDHVLRGQRINRVTACGVVRQTVRAAISYPAGHGEFADGRHVIEHAKAADDPFPILPWSIRKAEPRSEIELAGMVEGSVHKTLRRQEVVESVVDVGRTFKRVAHAEIHREVPVY